MTIKLVGDDDTKKPGRKRDTKNKICCKCKINKTYIDLKGYKNWHVCQCKKESCTGYLCHKCYMSIKNNLPDSYKNLKKSVTHHRTGNLSKNSDKGKSLISETVVAKYLNIENLNIRMDDYNYYIDMEAKNIGKIDVKGPTLICGIWSSSFMRRINCNTYVILGFDEKRENIDAVYIITNDGWICNLSSCRISKDPVRTSKYDKFKVPTEELDIYNRIYHDLMSYLKDKKFFGVDDIRGWYNKN